MNHDADIERVIFRQGVRRLAALLPAARAAYRRNPPGGEMISAIGLGMAPYVREDNLLALTVSPGGLGGWHCDIILREVPPAVSNKFGSPVQTPFRTKAEAEAAARLLLMSCFAIEERYAGLSPTPPPAFILHGWTLPLVPELYAKAEEVMPGFTSQAGEHAARSLRRIAELCPDGFDGDDFQTWERDKQNALMSVLHIAALNGIFRYPENRVGFPPAQSGA